jgi:hypothetical protein
MDWIKNRYDQFALALVAVLLLVCAALLALKSQSFAEKFADALNTVVPNEKIPPLVLDRVDEAKAMLEKPASWLIESKEPKTRGSLFVSERYILGPEGVPKKPKEGSLYTDSLTGKPIPNSWFLDNNLPLLDASVTQQDPDKDGFTNEDEWRESTDPNNKDSHPPYHTKLFLKQFIKVPFRLVFNAYDGDPKKDKPDKFSFQINTVDLRQPSEFKAIGDTIPNTKYRLEKFEYKAKLNPKTGEEEDLSELTLVNTETNEPVVLVLTRVTDSPDSYALFTYEWPPAAGDIKVKKLQSFGLKPGTTADYKLVDIKETEAVIQLPSGEKYTVPRDPRKAAK